MKRLHFPHLLRGLPAQGQPHIWAGTSSTHLGRDQLQDGLAIAALAQGLACTRQDKKSASFQAAWLIRGSTHHRGRPSAAFSCLHLRSWQPATDHRGSHRCGPGCLNGHGRTAKQLQWTAMWVAGEEVAVIAWWDWAARQRPACMQPPLCGGGAIAAGVCRAAAVCCLSSSAWQECRTGRSRSHHTQSSAAGGSGIRQLCPRSPHLRRRGERSWPQTAHPCGRCCARRR